jgi:uncharacterized protein
VIAYLDTSAIIPLLVDEPGSDTATQLWDSADRKVSVRLLYVEARAALAQAQRLGRITARQRGTLVAALDGLYAQLDRIEVDEPLVQHAGALAQEHGVRGYDAVHLAAAARIAGAETVFVSGDRAQCAAAARIGLAVANT